MNRMHRINIIVKGAMTDDSSMASILTFSQYQTICQIYPLVPATVLHYVMRNSDGPIAGMLLGVREGNIVSVRNCYPVLLNYSQEKDANEKDPTVTYIAYVIDSD